jgi:transcription elongation factor Elf1
MAEKELRIPIKDCRILAECSQCNSELIINLAAREISTNTAFKCSKCNRELALQLDSVTEPIAKAQAVAGDANLFFSCHDPRNLNKRLNTSYDWALLTR